VSGFFVDFCEREDSSVNVPATTGRQNIYSVVDPDVDIQESTHMSLLTSSGHQEGLGPFRVSKRKDRTRFAVHRILKMGKIIIVKN